MITLIKAKLKLAYLFCRILNAMLFVGHKLNNRLGRRIEDLAWRIMVSLQKWGERNWL